VNERIQAQVQPTQKSSFAPSSPRLLQRKCACGGTASLSGECEECSKEKRLGLETKLKVNKPGDIYEREADRVADQVLATPAHHAVSDAPPRTQRSSGQSNGQMDAAPASVEQALASPGRPLEPALRQDMEQRFGHDFSRVRVHSGTAAEQSAQDVNAHAYTVGSDIVFGRGRFTSNATESRRLLAHELTHVLQQSAGQAPSALARQPADAEKDKPQTPPKASKCHTGCSQRWGQDTTCSKWGFFQGLAEQGEGKRWRSFDCCNSWPLSVEDYARTQLSLSGAASCTVQHEREIATVTYGENEVQVLCSDTIPRAMFGETKMSPRACSGKISTEVIELSPKAMQDLSGQVANALHVEVCYSGSKEDLCLHNGPGARSFPTIDQCLTRGCSPWEGTPTTHEGSGWPRV